MYIEKINSPADVKVLSVVQMEVLATEVRQALLHKLSEHGGHIGPNLGMVEATIALHYVFNSPYDKIVYDVSHQSYTHKILTGRKEAFLNAADYDKVSGYTNPQESEHDFFTIGHTSTSVSLACGLVKARDLKGDSENIIAVLQALLLCCLRLSQRHRGIHFHHQRYGTAAPRHLYPVRPVFLHNPAFSACPALLFPWLPHLRKVLRGCIRFRLFRHL